MLKFVDNKINNYYKNIYNKYPIVLSSVRIHEWPDRKVVFSENTKIKTKNFFEKKH